MTLEAILQQFDGLNVRNRSHPAGTTARVEPGSGLCGLARSAGLQGEGQGPGSGCCAKVTPGAPCRTTSQGWELPKVSGCVVVPARENAPAVWTVSRLEIDRTPGGAPG